MFRMLKGNFSVPFLWNIFSPNFIDSTGRKKCHNFRAVSCGGKFLRSSRHYQVLQGTMQSLEYSNPTYISSWYPWQWIQIFCKEIIGCKFPIQKIIASKIPVTMETCLLESNHSWRMQSFLTIDLSK